MKKKFKNEKELCDAFIDLASGHGWKCYPECSNWDILLVKNDVQIGIQAKMHFNLDVVGQACPRSVFNEPKRGPHYRAILIPERPKRYKGWSSVASRVTERLRIWVFQPDGYGTAMLTDKFNREDRFMWSPEALEWTPDFVPDLPAGVPSPVIMSKWKQGAMKVIATGQKRGWLTTDDFKDYGINHTFFLDSRWMITEGKIGRKNRYVLNDIEGRIDLQFPDYYGKIFEAIDSPTK